MENTMMKEQLDSNSKLGRKKRKALLTIIALYTSLLILCHLCCWLYMKPVFFVLENKSLFIYSKDYFLPFTRVPGGLLEYLGNFLQQIYFKPYLGAILLSGVIVFQAAIFVTIAGKISGNKKKGIISITAISCLSVLLHADYNFNIQQQIGILLATLFFLFAINSGNRSKTIIIVVLYPVLYYTLGACAWFFIILFSIHEISSGNKKQRFLLPTILVTTSVITFLFYKNFLFLISQEKLFLHSLLNGKIPNKNPLLYGLYLLVSVFPLIVKINVTKKLSKAKAPLQITTFVLFGGLTLILLHKSYNQQAAHFYQLESHVFERNWKTIIRMHEKQPSKNLRGQFYYNLALSEEGLLCDRLFTQDQKFGEKSLIFPKELQSNIINSGVYFYYAIGLINEAHHWAYESFVSEGYRPESLKILVKTNLINGNYKIAQKYIHILKQTWHYRKWALEYEKMIFRPDLVDTDEELGKKKALIPKENFFVDSREPFKTLNYLAFSEGNKKAFEYIVARALLNKDVQMVANAIPKMKQLGYTRVPKHIEEAIFVYRNLTRGKLPELNGLLLSRETELNYKNYLRDFKKYRENKTRARKILFPKWGNTFWYYMHFTEIN